MSLWDVLIIVNSAALVGGALSAARVTHGGAPAYIVAIVTGVLLAVANAWTWTKVAHAVVGRIKPLPESAHERYFRLLYLAAAIWSLCAVAAGQYIVLGVLALRS